MIDVAATLSTLLLADAGLAALVGTRIWGGTDVPIRGYTPADGAAVVFRRRGGTTLGEQRTALVAPSIQFKIYGATDLAADAAYRALFDFLDTSPLPWPLRAATAESLGVPLEEPVTGWPFILTFYQLTFANTS